MFSFFRNFFFPSQSAFVINEVNYFRNVVLLEDKQLGIQVEVQIGDKPFKEAKVIAPYVVLLTYQDGSTEKKRILK